MDALERLPELSSFQSCIKYNGRSILPPVVSPAKKHEIDEIRHKVSVVQAKLEQRKLENFCMVYEVTEAHKALGKLHPDVVIHDVDDDNNKELRTLRSLNDTMPFSLSNNSSSSLEEIREEEEELVTTPSDKKLCDNVDQRNSIFHNSLLDNIESFEKHVKCINDINLFTYSNPERYINEIPYNNPFAMGSGYHLHSEQLLTPGEISDDQRLSETEAEHQSIDTVIINTYEELGCNLDSDSIITSVAQSSDLDKYLDCSGDGSQVSEHSLAVGDGKDVTECFDYSEATTSSETMVDHSNASTPVVPLLLQSFTTDNQSESTVVNPFNVTFPKQPQNDIDYESKGCLLSNSTSSYFQSKTSNNNIYSDNKQTMSTEMVQAEVNANETKYDKKVKQKACSRHKRSSSYTLDTTSPALLKSHAGCPCLESPSSVGIPHSRSIEFVQGSPVSDDETLPKFVLTEENINEQVFCMNGDIHGENMHSMNMTKAESKTNEVISDVGAVHRNSSNQMLLSALRETFKKIHEQRVEKLLKEQHEQWVKLQLEFDAQEQQLQQQIQSLQLYPTDGNSIQEPCSTIAQPSANLLETELKTNTQDGSQGPKVIANQSTTKEVFSPDALLSEHHSEVLPSPISAALNQKSVIKNCAKSDKRTSLSDAAHLASVLKAVQDPAMKKKFEKVSAAVKGYLTRRLLKTVQLQELLKTVQDTALQLAKLYEKTKDKNCSNVEHLIYQGLVKQLNTTCDKVHKIFFEYSAKQRMEIIARSRELEKQRREKWNRSGSSQSLKTAEPPPAIVTGKSKLSSATLKRLERKRLKNLSSVCDWNKNLGNHEISASIKKTRSAADICVVGSAISAKDPAHKRPHSSQTHSTSSDFSLRNKKVNGPSKNCITPKVFSE